MTPMDVNPYQPPTDAGLMRAHEFSPAERPAPRPLGISILAGVHLLVALLLVVATIILIWAADSVVITVGNSPMWFVYGLFALITVVALSTSIGMWLGVRWGWWLAAFYYVWGVLGVVAQFLVLFWQVDQWDVQTIASALPGRLIQLAIHALILLYLFKGSVRDFFRLRFLRIHQALIPMAIVAIALLVAHLVVDRLTSAGAF